MSLASRFLLRSSRQVYAGQSVLRSEYAVPAPSFAKGAGGATAALNGDGINALQLFDKIPHRIVAADSSPHSVQNVAISSTVMMRRFFLNSVASFKHYSSSASSVLKSGDVLKQSRIFSMSEITDYSKLTHDHNPLHFDLECARSSGFEDTPVPGLLVASLFPRIIASHFPGAVYVKQTLEFRAPVFVGDNVVGEVQANNIRQIKDKFMVKFTTTCVKDRGAVVIGGEATAILPSLAVKEVENLGN